MEIQARCFTNLDDYKREDWPCVFVTVPNVGDCVEAKSGKTLKVVRITHRQSIVDGEARPSIVVELHR